MWKGVSKEKRAEIERLENLMGSDNRHVKETLLKNFQ